MAEKFRFRLEVVRRVRKEVRDRVRRELADALRAVAEAEGRICALNDHLRESIGETERVQRNPQLNLVSLRGHQYFRGMLHRRLVESDIELERRKTIVREQRIKLADASRKHKAIDVLREKQWLKHVAQLDREERQTMDEAAVHRFNREVAARRRKVNAA